MRHRDLCPKVPEGETRIIFPVKDEDYVFPAALLACGELVAFPTETVYGLGADATNEAAVAKIFAAKGRPGDNPLIVHVARKSDIPPLVTHITPLAQCLMDAFMPGPVTLVMPKSRLIPDLVSAGLPTVGIRMPAHPVALNLIRHAGVPVAAPSANMSGSPSPTRAEHVEKDLSGRIPCIVDGGPCDVGIESTVIDVTDSWPVILRPGAITMSMLEDACAKAGILPHGQPDSLAFDAENQGVPKAPGMKYRHYAPKAEMTIVMPASGDRKTQYLEAVLSALSDCGDAKIGVFCGNSEREFLEMKLTPEQHQQIIFYVFGADMDIDAAARGLFDGIRSLDSAGVSRILADGFVGAGLEHAYMNRLEKAADAKRELEPLEADRESPCRSVLFVCTGNTCRSPMAEAIFNKMSAEKGPFSESGQPHAEVCLSASSAGIYAVNGSPAEAGAVEAAKNLFAADLSGHASRKTTDEMISENDMIFTVTREHAVILRRFFPELAWKIDSFSEYMSRKSIILRADDGTVRKTDIPDPFGQHRIVYEKTAMSLHAIIEAMWPAILDDLGIAAAD